MILVCLFNSYTLKNGSVEVKVINYGATITSLFAPDKNGKLDDVVLGYDGIDGKMMTLTLILPIATIPPYANSLDPDETPSNSASHPDPSFLTLEQYLHKFKRLIITLKIVADETLSRRRFIGRVRVNSFMSGFLSCVAIRLFTESILFTERGVQFIWNKLNDSRLQPTNSTET